MDVLILENIVNYRNLILQSDISFSKDMITEELYDVRINNILLEMDVAIQVLERARSASHIESEEVDIKKNIHVMVRP
jgi:hypothetical protein